MIAQAVGLANAVIPQESVTFLQALKQFFTIPQEKLMAEFKALSMQDRAELREGLVKVGYNIKPADATSSPPLVKKDDGPNYEADAPRVDTGYKVGQEHPAVAVANC